jgi:hypothetical protein
MPERAALYMVRIKQKYSQDGYRLLGNIDESGTALLSVFDAVARTQPTAEEPPKRLTCRGVRDSTQNDLVLEFELSDSGVVADIRDASGQHQYRRRFSDHHSVICFAYFRLPPAQRQGWLAVHITDGRGYKTLLERILRTELANRHDDLYLTLEPVVEEQILRSAINDDRIASVRLRRWERPGDRASEATSRWLRSDESGSIEVLVKPSRGRKLLGAPMREFWGASDPKARDTLLDSLVTFENVKFDEIKIEAQLPNGTRRTYNVRSPGGGHPITIDLDGLENSDSDDGGYTPESIISSLANLLSGRE